MTTNSQEPDSLATHVPRGQRDMKDSATFDSPDLHTAQALHVQGVEACHQALDRLENLSLSGFSDTEFLQFREVFEKGLDTVVKASTCLESFATSLKSAAERDSVHSVEDSKERYKRAMMCYEEKSKAGQDRETILIRYLAILGTRAKFNFVV